MKVVRVLCGELYTSPADKGVGYIRAVAEEDGYEIDYAGSVLWITDKMLEEARYLAEQREIANEWSAVDEDGLEDCEPQEVLKDIDTRCTVTSSVTEARCVLPAGHPSASHTRFHDFGSPPARLPEGFANGEECPRCLRPNAPMGCSFDCTTCRNCGKQIEDCRPRVFTTAEWVYCMECGK